MDKLKINPALTTSSPLPSPPVPEEKRTEWLQEARSPGTPKSPLDQAEIDARRAVLIGNSGIPRRYQGWTWDRLDVGGHNRQVVEALQAYDPTVPMAGGFLLCGKTGTGKTTLACLVGLTWLHRGLRVRFRAMQDLLAEVRATFGDQSGESERSVFRKLAKADLLILDDLGAERDTDWGRATVRFLIETVYNEATPCLCTTNLTPPDLQETYHGRSYGRLREMMRLLPLTGKSYRPT